MTSTTTTTKPLSARQAEAVRLHDEGLTNDEVGARMGITGGTAGNHVTNGLRNLGRGAEVGVSAGSSGATTVAVTTTAKPRTRSEFIAAAIEAERASLSDRLTRIAERVAAAAAAAEEFDAEEWIAARTEVLTTAVTDAENALRAFSEEADAAADAERERLSSTATTVADAAATERAAVEEALATFDE